MSLRGPPDGFFSVFSPLFFPPSAPSAKRRCGDGAPRGELPPRRRGALCALPAPPERRGGPGPSFRREAAAFPRRRGRAPDGAAGCLAAGGRNLGEPRVCRAGHRPGDFPPRFKVLRALTVASPGGVRFGFGGRPCEASVVPANPAAAASVRGAGRRGWGARASGGVRACVGVHGDTAPSAWGGRR